MLSLITNYAYKKEVKNNIPLKDQEFCSTTNWC